MGVEREVTGKIDHAKTASVNRLRLLAGATAATVALTGCGAGSVIETYLRGTQPSATQISQLARIFRPYAENIASLVILAANQPDSPFTQITSAPGQVTLLAQTDVQVQNPNGQPPVVPQLYTAYADETAGNTGLLLAAGQSNDQGEGVVAVTFQVPGGSDVITSHDVDSIDIERLDGQDPQEGQMEEQTIILDPTLTQKKDNEENIQDAPAQWSGADTRGGIGTLESAWNDPLNRAIDPEVVGGISTDPDSTDELDQSELGATTSIAQTAAAVEADMTTAWNALLPNLDRAAQRSQAQANTNLDELASTYAFIEGQAATTGAHVQAEKHTVVDSEDKKSTRTTKDTQGEQRVNDGHEPDSTATPDEVSQSVLSAQAYPPVGQTDPTDDPTVIQGPTAHSQDERDSHPTPHSAPDPSHQDHRPHHTPDASAEPERRDPQGDKEPVSSFFSERPKMSTTSSPTLEALAAPADPVPPTISDTDPDTDIDLGSSMVPSMQEL